MSRAHADVVRGGSDAAGWVRGKLGWLEGRPPIFTPEHVACAELARDHDIPLQTVMRAAQAAYEERQSAGKADTGRNS